MALAIAAGGKLYNVVVEDERASKDLLERWDYEMRDAHPANCALKIFR